MIQAPRAFSDPDLPAAPALLGERGGAAVSSFLGARGWEAREVRPVQILYRPGRSCVVRYRVRASSPAGAPRALSVCAETRSGVTEVLEPQSGFEARYGLAEPVDPAPPYLVWAFPYDPGLSSLPAAASGDAVKAALGESGPRPLAVEAQPVAYRPRRRAVFRHVALYGPRGERRRAVRFAKAMRTRAARRVVDLSAGVGSRIDGVRLALPESEIARNALLFDALPGTSLRSLLVRDGETLPNPTRVAGIVESLAGAGRGLDPAALPRRTGPVETAAFAASLLEAVVPECTPDIRRIVEAIERGADCSAGDDVLVHGDLYEAQIFVDAGSLGLLDVDGAGLGDPAVDAANFCAHLIALAMWAPSARRRLLAYRVVARRAFQDALGVGDDGFAWREALAMLQLATGPFRTLHPDWPAEIARRIGITVRLLRGPGDGGDGIGGP